MLAGAALLAALAQLVALAAQAPSQGGVSGPPETRTAPAPQCVCAAKEAAPADFILEGLVVDAELTLGADGRSANDRRATVFQVIAAKGAAGALGERARIFHNASSGACGVVFDYGKRYRVPVRRSAEGRLETDQCLMRAPAGAGAAPLTPASEDPA